VIGEKGLNKKVKATDQHSRPRETPEKKREISKTREMARRGEFFIDESFYWLTCCTAERFIL
jgi:hypothetical protein